MIPVRIGSIRLKMKNLAMINGKPMIYYVIHAAKKSGIFDKIVLNSDSELFAKIAEKPPFWVPRYRMESPDPVGSTLITSAPWSQRIMVASDAVTILDSSKIFIP